MVARGQIVGGVGTTGYSAPGPHLHFEVRVTGTPSTPWATSEPACRRLPPLRHRLPSPAHAGRSARVVVVLLVGIGFLGGYFAGWYLRGENTVLLAPPADSAQGARQAPAAGGDRGAAQRLLPPVDSASCRRAGVQGMLKSASTTPTPSTSRRKSADLQGEAKGTYSGIGAGRWRRPGRARHRPRFQGRPAQGGGPRPRRPRRSAWTARRRRAPASDEVVDRIKGASGTTVKLTDRPRARRPALPEGGLTKVVSQDASRSARGEARGSSTTGARRSATSALQFSDGPGPSCGRRRTGVDT